MVSIYKFAEGVITRLVLLLDGSPFVVSILSPLPHWQSPSCYLQYSHFSEGGGVGEGDGEGEGEGGKGGRGEGGKGS